ncbi:MAG TPA: adenosine kinase [Dongiaceae bacterium]|jgi:sugar/nucleoside kinase (ribokinase family)|nr:adenosine kinase [Dongiaceae bacterium]
MAERLLDVVGIGNAIVDVLANADEDLLVKQGMVKGAMTLIDAARAEALYSVMGAAIEVSGGSAANTIAGLASLGARAGFMGKIGNDQLGGIFRHDIQANGVVFETASAKSATPTARCLIFVTPDAQRTLNTYLGACIEFGPDDVDATLVAHAKVTYLEGYLWDPPAAKAAFLKAAKVAREAGRKVALSLSDAFCVERHRAEFRELLREHVDILFANEAEICSLWQVDSFDKALQATRGQCDVAALTRSARGSVILSGKDVHIVDAARVSQVVDTTGAGDLYAAGFLYGYTGGRDPYDCGRIGAIAAAEVIGHYGARPETPLSELLLSKF